MEIAPPSLENAKKSFWFFQLRRFILLLLVVFLSYLGLVSLNSGGFPLVILILLIPFTLFRQFSFDSSSFHSLTLKEILYLRKKSRSVEFDIALGVIIYSIVYFLSWEVIDEELSMNYDPDFVPTANFFHKSYGILLTGFIVLYDYFLVKMNIEKITKKVFYRTNSFTLKSGGFLNKQRGFDSNWVLKWDHTVNLDEYLDYLEEKCENDLWWPDNDFFDPPKDWVG